MNTPPVQSFLRLPAFFLLSVITLAMLSGCALKVKLVGQYDDIVDKSTIQLQESTSIFFASMQSASDEERSYEANRQFYAQSQGKAATLIVRSEAIEAGLDKTPLTDNFKDLLRQFEELEQTHKEATPSAIYFSSAEQAFNQSFRAITEHLLYLKWNQEQPE